MSRKKKSFMARHKIGWIGVGTFVVLWIITSNIYSTFRASFEASVAVNQLKDSIIQYSIVQKVLYGNLGPNIINGIFFVLIILCLIPTVKDVIRFAKGKV